MMMSPQLVIVHSSVLLVIALTDVKSGPTRETSDCEDTLEHHSNDTGCQKVCW